MTRMIKTKYYGKYRGTVVNNVDPLNEGRLNVQVPDVLAVTPSTWAMPCFQSAGKQMGSWALPQVGSGVWVEFEQGDPDFPIWTGCWFGSAAEVPAVALAAPPAVPNIVFQTQNQNSIAISNMPAMGLLLKSATGALIQISDVGITLSNGKGAIITLARPSVTINAGALVVT